jgi:hypothetical protein
MATQKFRGALRSASFPLVSTMQGRTVVQAQLDLGTQRQQRTPAGGAEAAISDPDIPQILYCENVIPTGEGYMSVKFVETLVGIPGSSAFDSVINLRDSDERTFPYSPAGGLNYIFKAATNSWISTNPNTALAGRTITRAFVNGRTFICFSGMGVYEYDSGTDALVHLTLIGLTDAAVSGIGGSSNYLLAYDTTTIYWSSLINPLDFVPSLITGAGFAVPQDVRGNITAILGTNGGFVIYTPVNAVAAVFSNNSRSPFNYKEITNAGGVMSYEQVSSEQSSGIQYAWTSNGLQKITLQTSEPVSGEVNDFLTGRVYEDYDRVTNRLILTQAPTTEFSIKVAYISGRCLVLSYSVDGSGTYQYALLYDTTLKRWGKLKIEHVDCFAYRPPALVGDLSYDDLVTTGYDDLGITAYDGLATGIVTAPASKRAIGFLSADGTVKVLVADYNKDTAEDGVIIFGKFQLIRARLFTLQTADFEGGYADAVDGNSLVRATAMATLDGANMDVVADMKLLRATRFTHKFAKRITGTNVSIALDGSFALSSYLIEGEMDGDR